MKRPLVRPTAAAAGVALVAAGVAALPASPARADVAVTTLADAGPGSLRAAIESANAATAETTISFGVNGRIALASALPALQHRTIINGASAPGYRESPVVQVDYQGHAGLELAASATGSTVSGLSFTGASDAGITVRAPDVILTDNYIGLAPDGRVSGNAGDGVAVAREAVGTTIGENLDTVSGAVSNVISGNGGSGIRVTEAARNIIQANRIGTDPRGLTAIPNGGDGITLESSRLNLIGGTAYTDGATGETNDPTGEEGTVPPVFVIPPLGNLISGNEGDGVRLAAGSAKNQLSGNFVGTTATGDAAIGNGGNGVRVAASDHNVLRGCRFTNNPFVYYNVLSGNGRNGLAIHDSDHTKVQANFFGVGADNTTVLGNRRNGILVNGTSTHTQVGGVIPLGNVAAGNGRNGIAVTGRARSFTTFNTFGGLLAFKGAAPNGENGLLITATGGDQLVRTNVMSGNSGNGIELAGRATGVTIDPNIVGLNTRGTGVLANGGSGLFITGRAHHNRIGGRKQKQSVIRQNTLSGNDDYGLVIEGDAHHNKVFNTFIGSNIKGDDTAPVKRVGNAQGGVLIDGDAHHNRIGYEGGVTINKLVSGNDGPGVRLTRSTHHNEVLGTYIGLGRHGRCLVNRGRNVINRGSNLVRGNYYCSPSHRDGDRPGGISGRG